MSVLFDGCGFYPGQGICGGESGLFANADFYALSHGLKVVGVPLAPSEHKQFAGLGLRVKVEPAQLGLAAAPVYRKVADLFPRLDAPVTLDGVYQRPPGPPAAADAALLGQEVVGVTLTSSIVEYLALFGDFVKEPSLYISSASSFYS